jgi:hypothetical protein
MPPRSNTASLGASIVSFWAWPPWLAFMESAYQAGAKSAGWDIEALRTHLPAREAVKLRRGH